MADSNYDEALRLLNDAGSQTNGLLRGIGYALLALVSTEETSTEEIHALACALEATVDHGTSTPVAAP